MNYKKHIQKITAFLFAILLIYSCAKDDSQKSLPENKGVSGHVDILRTNGTCPSYCNFQLPVERTDI